MRSLFVICVATMVSCGFSVKEETIGDANSVQERTKIIDVDCVEFAGLYDFATLCDAYNKLQTNPQSYDAQCAFFHAFPNTWWNFVLLYGYHKNYSMNTRYADKHLAAFFNGMAKIEDSIYCEKIINLAIGARIDADAPNLFQRLLHRRMTENPDIMMSILSGKLKSDQLLFWEFYWATLYRKPVMEAEFQELYGDWKEVYPQEMERMAIAFENFCGESRFSE